ncbi:MAG: GlsB/YeaQ/YmgE family stress response membrane protein [Tepidiformaceae bacterium]
MGLLSWIIFGLIAGAIAQVIMPGDDPGGRSFTGWLITAVIGIVGAIVGGFIATALGMGDVSGFNFGSFVIAVVGALVLLFVWRQVAGRSGAGRGVR